MSRNKTAQSVFAALCLCTVALSAPVKFAYQQANTLATAIAGLDQGSKKSFEQGQGNPPKVEDNWPFDFSGKTTVALAGDLSQLKTALQQWEDARQSIAKAALKAGGTTDPAKLTTEQKSAGDAKVQDAFNEQKTIDILFVTATDLGIDSDPKKNNIPLSIISALDPIRGDLVKPPAK